MSLRAIFINVSIALLLIFLIAPAYSEFYVIRQFDGGLNSHVSDYLISKDQSARAENVRYNKVFGALGKREFMIETYDVGSDNITGLHRFYKSNGVQQTIVTSGQDVMIADDDTGDSELILGNQTDGRRWNFITFKDILIGLNGVDDNIKYDGKITARGTSFQGHLSLLSALYNEYADIIRNLESAYVTKVEDFNSLKMLSGEALALQFNKPIADLETFLSRVFSSSLPFRLWGIPIRISEGFYRVCAADTDCAYAKTPDFTEFYLADCG